MASAFTDPQYRPDVDGLRAIAVLSVMVFHFAPGALPGGFLGVDIFFVISGFLITQLLLRQVDGAGFDVVDFYRRRLRRLAPALMLVLASTLVAGYWVMFATEFVRLGTHILHAMAFVLNFRLADEVGYFDVAAESKPLLHLWSLSIEEQFYLAWPWVLWMICRAAPAKRLILVGLLALSSLAFAVWQLGMDPTKLYFHPLARFWELLLGAAVGTHQRYCGVSGVGRVQAIAWPAVLVLVAGLVLSSSTYVHPGLLTLPPLLCVAALLALPGTSVARMLACRPMVWVGLISYPLYLWHWPLLAFARIASSGKPSAELMWAAAGLSLLFAGLTYRLVERPLRSGWPDRRAVPVLLGGLLLVAVFAWSVRALQGLPERESQRAWRTAQADWERAVPTNGECLDRLPRGRAPYYCRWEGVGLPRLAVIGDSHADAVFPGIVSQAKIRNASAVLLANSGCPPLLGVQPGRAYDRPICADHVGRVLQGVEVIPAADWVLIATRGPIYITGEGFGAAEASYKRPPLMLAGNEQVGGLEAFVQGLRQTVLHLQGQGKRVAYLLQVPELGVTREDCLGRPLQLGFAAGKCSVSEQLVLARMQAYREGVNRLAKELPGLVVLDPMTLLCAGGTCAGRDGARLLYADDNHLSAHGAARVGAWIWPQLIAAGMGVKP